MLFFTARGPSDIVLFFPLVHSHDAERFDHFATTLLPLTEHGRHHNDRPAGSCKLLKRFSGGLFRNFHGQVYHSI